MAILPAVFTAILGAILLLVLSLYRLLAITSPQRPKSPTKNHAHLLIVLGSGGHTAEMLAMLDRAVNEQKLSWSKFTHRTWVISFGDALSAQRAKAFEEQRGEQSGYDIRIVPRAREIHQSVYTAPISSLRCMMGCARVLMGGKGERGGYPDAILCNGPATATIMVFTSIVLRFFGMGEGKMRTIYVESFARVKRLSLSGKLLSRVVDRFLVQWPQLEEAGGRVEYAGILV